MNTSDEPISGVVERITFHNLDNGYVVLKVRVPKHRDLVTVVGNLTSVVAGEYIEAHGQWVNDKTHGPQFKADELKTTPPHTAAGIAKYLGSGLIKGIGPTYAKRIVEVFGDRTLEVTVAQELLQTMGFRTFVPLVAACPGCGRTTSTVFQELARDIQNYIRDEMPAWKIRYPGVEGLNVAVMGCIVNGPGESKHADIGISLPGTGETPAAPVFIDGKKAVTLRGAGIASEFKQLVDSYIENKFGAAR